MVAASSRSTDPKRPASDTASGRRAGVASTGGRSQVGAKLAIRRARSRPLGHVVAKEGIELCWWPASPASKRPGPAISLAARMTAAPGERARARCRR